jgi:excisionase family DNA binding protein
VSESTVRRLAREGRIPSVRLTPRLVRFRLAAVLQALDRAARPAPRRGPDEQKPDDAQLTFAEML